MKFVFADGEKIGVFEENGATVYESNYIRGYKANALKSVKSKEWKTSTDVMFDEEYYFNTPHEEEIQAQITSVGLTKEENKIVYSFTVNGTSGIYGKYLDDKEKTEAHILTSNDAEFFSLCMTEGGEMLGCVRNNSVSSDIAVFSIDGGDYKSLTGGDSLDENPSFDNDGNVLFNSYGVGRDSNNVFVTYTPSEIYRLNVTTLQTELLVTNEKYSYIKPIMTKSGELYCIRKPSEEKEERNVFLEILLIPVRIIEAIVGFISAFVMCFSGKPMVSGQSARSIGNGGELARNGKGDPKKAFINNNLVNVEKELKRNKKSEEYGFIPRSWKLVRLRAGKYGNFEEYEEFEIAGGVADYALIEEGEENVLVYTNGKHIFKVIDAGDAGKKEKLFNVDFCLKVGGIQKTKTQKCVGQVCDDGLFERI